MLQVHLALDALTASHHPTMCGKSARCPHNHVARRSCADISVLLWFGFHCLRLMHAVREFSVCQSCRCFHCPPSLVNLPLVQALEGTVLQQLQVQSDKLSAATQAMSQNAAECGEDSGTQPDQPAAPQLRVEAGAAAECMLDMAEC